MQVAYDALISTVPLDTTLRWLGKPEWANGLQHSSSHIIGIGAHCSAVVLFTPGRLFQVQGSACMGQPAAPIPTHPRHR